MSAPTAALAAFRVDYGHDVEEAIQCLTAALAEADLGGGRYPPRWLALKLLEGETDIVARVQQLPDSRPILTLAHELSTGLRERHHDDPDLILADRRYSFINGLVRQVVRRPLGDRLALTRRIDNVVTHRWLGLPIFFAVMYLVFYLVMNVSAPYLNWVDGVINGPIARWLAAILGVLRAPEWLRSLVVDGVVAGVGSVLVFVPGLLILYFFLALLEDSGYLARAAFVMDRFMRVVGLHGKSFIPMILGLGCAVPAIYATRTIAGRRDRLVTALLVPLMSCSARLPVYVVFGLAFFGDRADVVVWTLYALGILTAILAGLVFTRTLLKPDLTSAFVLELPPYRWPSLKGVLIHTWDRTSGMLHKAGTTILAVSILMWLLLNLPWGVTAPRDSYFGRVSAAIAPAFEPLGFGRWDTAGALVSGFVAKEVVVSTLSQMYVGSQGDLDSAVPPTLGEDLLGIVTGFATATFESGKTLVSVLPGVNLVTADAQAEDTALSQALRARFTPLTAFALLVFVLLYVPCAATLGALTHEFGRRWAVFSAVYQTLVAWLAAFLVYQGGRLLGLG